MKKTECELYYGNTNYIQLTTEALNSDTVLLRIYIRRLSNNFPPKKGIFSKGAFKEGVIWIIEPFFLFFQFTINVVELSFLQDKCPFKGFLLSRNLLGNKRFQRIKRFQCFHQHLQDTHICKPDKDLRQIK